MVDRFRRSLHNKRNAQHSVDRMTITLDQALEAAIRQDACLRGVAPEQLALEALQLRFLGAQTPLEPRDEWERRLLSIGTECGVSMPDWALSSEGLYD